MSYLELMRRFEVSPERLWFFQMAIDTNQKIKCREGAGYVKQIDFEMWESTTSVFVTLDIGLRPMSGGAEVWKVSLAEQLAEKVCGNSSLPTRRWLGQYDEVLAAINEAILLTKNEWIERCAEEADLADCSCGWQGSKDGSRHSVYCRVCDYKSPDRAGAKIRALKS